MSNAKWVITGGAGFIGSNIANELVKRRQEVVIYDNFSTGTIEALDGIKNKVKIIRGDIGDMKTLTKAFKGADYVLHHAALISVAESVEKPQKTFKENVEGTSNVLESARAAKVKRVVLASSAAVYGNAKKMPCREDYPADCRSPYAASKLAGEELLKMYYKTYGLETVSLRYFNVFGPGQRPNSQYAAVISKFIELTKKGNTIYVDWDGRQSRDFVYIKDIVAANIIAALKAAPGEVYNIASGKTHSLLQLAAVLEKLSGKKMRRIFRPKREGDIKKSAADISKIKKAGYRPLVSLEKGLKALWEREND